MTLIQHKKRSWRTKVKNKNPFIWNIHIVPFRHEPHTEITNTIKLYFSIYTWHTTTVCYTATVVRSFKSNLQVDQKKSGFQTKPACCKFKTEGDASSQEARWMLHQCLWGLKINITDSPTKKPVRDLKHKDKVCGSWSPWETNSWG